MKQYKWSTHKVIQETKDAITIVFDTGLPAFSYQPGQYLNITCNIDGASVSRSYSFSSSVSDRFPSITVKRIPGGTMSNYLFTNAADINEWDVEAPLGNFVMGKNIPEEAELVFLAGGSGMSPLLSMLNSTADSTRQPLLLYASHTAEDIIFRARLEQMQADNRLNVFYALSAAAPELQEQNSISGRFSQAVIESIISREIQAKDTAHYFICGPAGLMQLYRDALSALLIPETQIHTEYFDPVPGNNMIPETGNEPKEILVSYFESYNLNDEAQTCESTCLVEVRAGQSILDAMSEHEIKVPHSCKKGTCGSCRATMENGSVHMLSNYALTNEEIAEGQILLCQSFPLDQSVAIVIG